MADVTLDEAAIATLIGSPAGPVGRLISSLAQATTKEAKSRAPVGDKSSKKGHPSGYLRSQIDWKLGVLGGVITADVISNAVTSRFNPRPEMRNQPYAYFAEVPSAQPYKIPSAWAAKQHPYLVPALVQVVGALGTVL